MLVHADQNTLWLEKSIFACISCKGMSWLWLHKVQCQARDRPVNQIFQSRWNDVATLTALMSPKREKGRMF